MEELNLTTYCKDCSNLMGCKHLADTFGRFVSSRVVNETNSIDCDDWSPVGPRQKSIRDTLLSLQGESSLRVLHQVPFIVMHKIVEQEKADEMMIDSALDFVSMLYEGITTTEREIQLRFETDENGNLVQEEGSPRPRPAYQLRKFACDPEGHVGLDHSVGLFWTIDQVVKYILAAEVEQGLVTRVKKSKTKDSTSSIKAAKAAATENNMAGRRVMINRGGKKAGASAGDGDEKPKGAGKIANPPAKVGGKKGPSRSPKAASAAADDTAPSTTSVVAAVDYDEMRVVFGEVVNKAVAEAKNEIMANIMEHIDGRAQETVEFVNDMFSTLHDLNIQLGVYDESVVEPIWDTEGRFASYMPSAEEGSEGNEEEGE